MLEFDPKIIAFCCHYCAYTAADMAGSQKLKYPTNINIVRVPCSGNVKTIHILKAFQNGFDGVYVAGCLPNDCHFKNGNTIASKRISSTRKLLNEIGINGDRLEMLHISAGMGEYFAKFAYDITAKIKALGPNPICKTSLFQERKSQE